MGGKITVSCAKNSNFFSRKLFQYHVPSVGK